MLTKNEASIIAFAFILGLIVPFILSIISMMVSFRVGVTAAVVLVPLSSIRGLDEGVIAAGNGAVYAGVALLIILLRR